MNVENHYVPWTLADFRPHLLPTDQAGPRLKPNVENHNKPWMLADLRDLDAMYGNGDTYKIMAKTLGRTKGGIWAALNKFGIMEKRGSRQTLSCRKKISDRLKKHHMAVKSHCAVRN